MYAFICICVFHLAFSTTWMSTLSVKLCCKNHNVIIIASSLLFHVTTHQMEAFWILNCTPIRFWLFLPKGGEGGVCGSETKIQNSSSNKTKTKKPTTKKKGTPAKTWIKSLQEISKRWWFLLMWFKFIVSRLLKPHHENTKKKKK